MRLVDADAILDTYCYNCGQKSICEDGESVCSEREAVYDALFEAPTIEAEPVKHGRWIYPYPDRDICRCSNCGFNVQDKISNVSEMFLACPRCFARMGGDSE